MLEIDARCGLGRKGRWTRGERTLTTPLVLFLQGGARAAPSYAEGLLVSERTEDPRFQVRVGGSFFAPRPANDPDDLPAAKGIPLALADLEIPHEAVAGDWAVVSGESDLVAAKAVPGVVIANGPEFERSPRGTPPSGAPPRQARNLSGGPAPPVRGGQAGGVRRGVARPPRVRPIRAAHPGGLCEPGLGRGPSAPPRPPPQPVLDEPQPP